MARHCPFCGVAVSDTALFCTACGSRQPRVEAQTEQSQAPAKSKPRSGGAAKAPPKGKSQKTAREKQSPVGMRKPPILGYSRGFLLAAGLSGLALLLVLALVWPGFLLKDGTPPVPVVPVESSAGTGESTRLPDSSAQEPSSAAPTEFPLPDSNPFGDVSESDPNYPALVWALQREILRSNLADPNSAVTRAEAFTFLWRAMGSPKSRYLRNPMTDVDLKSYYCEAALWALEQGYLPQGTEKFHPKELLTRREAVMLLWQLAAPKEENPRAYVDLSESDQCWQAANWSYAAGIVARGAELRFEPEGELSRGQWIAALARTLEPGLALPRQAPEADGFEKYQIQGASCRAGDRADFLAVPKEEDRGPQRLSVTLEDYQILESSPEYEARPGWEWRVGTFLIGYGSSVSAECHFSLTADYQDSRFLHIYADNRSEKGANGTQSYVLIDGMPQQTLTRRMRAETAQGALYRVTMAAQVPRGYEGLAVCFCDQSALQSRGSLAESYSQESFAIFLLD